MHISRDIARNHFDSSFLFFTRMSVVHWFKNVCNNMINEVFFGFCIKFCMYLFYDYVVLFQGIT